MPWTPTEDAALGRAFIDLDLDGPPLYKWCRKNNILRSPGAIDARLAKLNFFDTPDDPPGTKRMIAHTDRIDKKEEQRRKAALNLKNQIALAKLEKPFAAPYKNEECWG